MLTSISLALSCLGQSTNRTLLSVCTMLFEQVMLVINILFRLLFRVSWPLCLSLDESTFRTLLSVCQTLIEPVVDMFLFRVSLPLFLALDSPLREPSYQFASSSRRTHGRATEIRCNRTVTSQWKSDSLCYQNFE